MKRNGVNIELTLKIRTLEVLHDPQKVFSREELLQKLGAMTLWETRAVDICQQD